MVMRILGLSLVMVAVAMSGCGEVPTAELSDASASCSWSFSKGAYVDASTNGTCVVDTHTEIGIKDLR